MGMWADDGALRVLNGIQLALAGTPQILGSDMTDFVFTLFKLDFTESRSNTVAAMLLKEADFVGFARLSTAATFPFAPSIAAGDPRLSGGLVTFTKTVGNPDQTIYGWGILGIDTHGAATALLLAKKFAAARVLTDAANTLSFEPYLGSWGI